MNRLTLMNSLLMTVTVCFWLILTLVFFPKSTANSAALWSGFILIHCLAGFFVGMTGNRAMEAFQTQAQTNILSGMILLAGLLLTMKLVLTMGYPPGTGSVLRSILSASLAMCLGYGIPYVIRMSKNQMSEKNVVQGVPPDTKITEVILEETGIRCPICHNYPEHEGHYIIHCYHCGAEFCSKHIDQYEERCWRCRTPVPFLTQLKQAVKENIDA